MYLICNVIFKMYTRSTMIVRGVVLRPNLDVLLVLWMYFLHNLRVHFVSILLCNQSVCLCTTGVLLVVALSTRWCACIVRHGYIKIDMKINFHVHQFWCLAVFNACWELRFRACLHCYVQKAQSHHVMHHRHLQPHRRCCTAGEETPGVLQRAARDL